MKRAPFSESRWWCHALARLAVPFGYAPDIYTAKCPRLSDRVYERFG